MKIPYIHKVKEELRFARLASDLVRVKYWEKKLKQLREEEKNG